MIEWGLIALIVVTPLAGGTVDLKYIIFTLSLIHI